MPIVTPFFDDAARSVDHGALYALVSPYRAEGIAGFVACGSTGEAAARIDQEQADVFGTVRAAADGLPVVMGLSGSALAPVRERMLRLAGHHPAAFLMPAPSYIRPSQAGLLEYFTALADASPVPLLLYDIPYRTGTTLTAETLLTLAGHPNIHGMVGPPGGFAARKCQPCPRTPVTHVSGPYILPKKVSKERRARDGDPSLNLCCGEGKGANSLRSGRPLSFFLPATQIQGAI